MAVSPQGTLYLSWLVEGTGTFVKRWNGVAWEDVGSTIGPSVFLAEKPVLAFDEDGVVAIGWAVEDAQGSHLYVKRYNR